MRESRRQVLKLPPETETWPKCGHRNGGRLRFYSSFTPLTFLDDHPLLVISWNARYEALVT